MKLAGVIDVVPVPNGVAVVADQYWRARQALKALNIKFDGGDNSSVSSQSMAKQYRAALDGNSWKTVKTEGQGFSVDELEGKFPGTYAQEYESQFLAHATMEPMNCTAHVTEDSCTVWGPLQGPELAKLTLAGMLKLPPEKVTIDNPQSLVVVAAILPTHGGEAQLREFAWRESDTSRATEPPLRLHLIFQILLI